MQEEIALEDWADICCEAYMVTNSNMWRKFKWKIILRYFRIPQIVTKMNTRFSDKCLKECGVQSGNNNQKQKLFWGQV